MGDRGRHRLSKRRLTLENTVEFFNLVPELKLSQKGKEDLVAFMRCLSLSKTRPLLSICDLFRSAVSRGLLDCVQYVVI